MTDQSLFDRHRETLDAAVAAMRSRGSTTRRIRRVAVARGSTASPRPPRARRRSRRWLGTTFPLDDPGQRRGGRATEQSPYGFDLGVSYPRAHRRVDALLAAARSGMRAWRDAGPEARVGVCIEILDRLHARVFELAQRRPAHQRARRS